MALIDKITAIGDAIREKNGTTELISFVDMPQAILDIETCPAHNLAYGEVAPDDTSKLWVKTQEPDGVYIVNDLGNVDCAIEAQCGNLDIGIEVNDSVCVIGDKIYIVAGYSDGFLSDVRCFDTVSGKTEILGDLGDALNASMVAAVNDNIYVFGGWSDSRVTLSDKIYCFNITTNTARTIDATITARENGSAVAVGDKIYLLGGFGSGNYNMPIEIFDTATETIEKLSITTPYGQGSRAVAMKKDIYYIRGWESGSYSSYIDKFNTEDNSFASTGIALSYQGWATGVCTFGEYIYVLGGKNPKYTGGFSDYLQIVNTKTRNVSVKTILPTRLSAMGVAEINGKVFFVGGRIDEDQDTSAVHCLKTIAPCEKNSLYITTRGVSNGSSLNIATNVNVVEDFLYKRDSDDYISIVDMLRYINGKWEKV